MHVGSISRPNMFFFCPHFRSAIFPFVEIFPIGLQAWGALEGKGGPLVTQFFFSLALSAPLLGLIDGGLVPPHPPGSVVRLGAPCAPIGAQGCGEPLMALAVWGLPVLTVGQHWKVCACRV